MSVIFLISMAVAIAVLVVAFRSVRGDSIQLPPEPAARPSLQTTGELIYESRGQGEPVLLIHGALIEDTFLPLLGQPALSDYRLILYHRRGYGRSAPFPGPVDMSDQAADACAVLDHLGIARAHVVGLSGGGVVALQLALDAPERVQSLVLLEPALMSSFMSGLSWRDLFNFVLVKARAALGNPEGAARVFAGLAGGPDWREDTAQVAPWAADQVDRAARVFFDVDFPSTSSFEWNDNQAARISPPVLWIHGGKSMMSVDTAKQLVPTWFPKSEFTVVPDATHMLPMHKPRPIAEAIARFLPKHGF